MLQQSHSGMKTLRGSSHFLVAGLNFSLTGHCICLPVQLLEYHSHLQGIVMFEQEQSHSGMLPLCGSSHFFDAGLNFSLTGHRICLPVQLLMYHSHLQGIVMFVQVQSHSGMKTLRGSSHFFDAGLNFSLTGHCICLPVQLFRYHSHLQGIVMFVQWQSHSGISQGFIQPALHRSSQFCILVLKCCPFGHSSLFSKVSLIQIK